MDKIFYIAYGSNMNFAQMRERCLAVDNTEADGIHRAYLENWKLTMPHFANIEPAFGERTPVYIWKISKEHKKMLDKKEYVASGQHYYEAHMFIEIEGVKQRALVYIMTPIYKGRTRESFYDKTRKEGFFEDYKKIVKQGYRDAGFDESEFGY